MENHIITSNNELSSGKDGDPLNFDEVDFFAFMTEQGYARQQLSKVRYGLKYLQTYSPLEQIIPQISNLKYLTEMGEILRQKFSSDVAKIALNSVHRLRDYFLDRGVIENSLMLRTSGYFGEVEERLHRYIFEERKYGKVHSQRIVKAYERFAGYLVSNSQADFSEINPKFIFNYFSFLKPCRTDVVTLRVLLQFLFREGYLAADYSPLILCAKRKNNEVRKFLHPDDIQKLLEAIDRNTVSGKRSYLFFTLMSKLGMRGSEILRMRIDDIDWKKSRVFVNGKHDKLTTLPFSQEVGDAMFDYLKHSRRIESGHLIVSLKPPFKKLTNTGKLNDALHRMYQKSGVKCPTKKVLINVFRHSLATGQLNAGSSILEVRDLMRHDNIATTMIYAKYNLKSLANLAAPWPEAMQ